MTAGTGGAVRRAAAVVAAVLTVTVTVAACGAAADPVGPAKVLRLGFFPNLTHATALVGLARGFYARRLGATALRTQTFNAGPGAVEALFSGDLDAAYLGPGPALNAWAQSHGQAIRIVAGATSGGASLVVRPGITSPQDLRGSQIATPQLGNTQDVALRAWLRDHRLRPSTAESAGDVSVEPTDNATTLVLFRSGRLDGAWVPEPWASRLVLEGGGHVLVNERSLWPAGKFVTTTLVVRTEFLTRHPQTVRALLVGQLDANAWIAAHPDQAPATANAELSRVGGARLSDPVLHRAFGQFTTTNDPLAATLRASAAHAVAAGLLKPVDPHGIYDLRLLRQVLTARHLPAPDDAGLGRDAP
ncbi:MAG TPA: ABC transporter substrate-binding protein [Mycobacteriales bacterium]|nr:ABC transporter substrate-binding protein [Mycobacteriales bacterium]